MPDRILRAMAVPMEDHRSSAFPALARECLNGLKAIFKTSGFAVHFPFIRYRMLGGGSHQLSQSRRSHTGRQLRPVRLPLDRYVPPPWTRSGSARDRVGQGAPVERYQAALEADRAHAIKAVLVCHNETATGVTSDVLRFARRSMPPSTRPCCSSMPSAHWPASISAWMNGRWTCASAVHRRA